MQDLGRMGVFAVVAEELSLSRAAVVKPMRRGRGGAVPTWTGCYPTGNQSMDRLQHR